jgi:signal transduction histidine kinase/CheY-like chemotaxis protein
MTSIIDSLSFSREYLRAALLVSLLSVWVLVALFYYLNRYTKRDYFTAWTAAWLFYALWLTLNLQAETNNPASIRFVLAQCCVAISSVFLFWGSLRFLNMPVRQTLLGLFLTFIIVWTLAGPYLAQGALQIQLPVFMLIGAGSTFAGVCFFRFRRKMPFVGAGMLSMGFLLWGLYLVTYPLSQQYENLSNAGYFVAAVLQLFIAVSMIVLVLEEVRMKAEQAIAEIAAIRMEKEHLELKVITAEGTCQHLYDKVRVTEGKQKAYEELRRTQHLVVRQERLRAIGQMASGLAHDLNNLLTPIMGYCDLILYSPKSNLADRERQMTVRIKKAADDIARIVSRMRSFYRPRSEQDRVELTEVNQAITEVVEMTRPRWRDVPQRDGISIEINQELSPQLPLLLSDASELRQALTNLVFNAVDAMPKGGTITIASRAIEHAPAGPGGTPVPAIQIEVQDEGVGMDEHTRLRCLEPFYSTKGDRGGTGLGLAMVYGMVQRQEGDIEIESAVGSGTRIRLILPIQPDRKSEPAAVPAATPKADSTAPLHVLYIDDEPMVRNVIGDCLRFLNHDVTLASNGEAGLQMFSDAMRSPKPFDAVITDFGMPHLNGKDVAKAIKARHPSMPVIVLTGWNSVHGAHGPRTDGAINAVLGKPPSLEELNSTLRSVTTSVAAPC